MLEKELPREQALKDYNALFLEWKEAIAKLGDWKHKDKLDQFWTLYTRFESERWKIASRYEVPVSDFAYPSEIQEFAKTLDPLGQHHLTSDFINRLAPNLLAPLERLVTAGRSFLACCGNNPVKRGTPLDHTEFSLLKTIENEWVTLRTSACEAGLLAAGVGIDATAPRQTCDAVFVLRDLLTVEPRDLWGFASLFDTTFVNRLGWVVERLREGVSEGANTTPRENMNANGIGTGDQKKAIRPKRSSGRGEREALLISALTMHHNYDNGDLKLEPIGNNELARKAKADKSTASAFFKKHFGGHGKYKVFCARGDLLNKLRVLNREYPHCHSYSYGEDNRNED
jgi:hypothetical protein